jgi:hypothetical protein
MTIYDFQYEKLIRSDHVTGSAICLQCGHTFQSIAPAGVHAFECPSCHTNKAVFQNGIEPPIFYVCECGCNLFVLSEYGSICWKCGQDVDPYSEE